MNEVLSIPRKQVEDSLAVTSHVNIERRVQKVLMEGTRLQ